MNNNTNKDTLFDISNLGPVASTPLDPDFATRHAKQLAGEVTTNPENACFPKEPPLFYPAENGDFNSALTPTFEVERPIVPEKFEEKSPTTPREQKQNGRTKVNKTKTAYRIDKNAKEKTERIDVRVGKTVAKIARSNCGKKKKYRSYQEFYVAMIEAGILRLIFGLPIHQDTNNSNTL